MEQGERASEPQEASGQQTDSGEFPPDFPEDSDAQVYYALADILAAEVARLRKGDGEQLKALTSFLVRAVYKGDLSELNDAPGTRDPSRPRTRGCKNCSRCWQDFLTCKQPYKKCIERLQTCVSCPCNPG